MNRKAKLEKALAIQKLNPSRLSRQFNQGKEAENSRLAPLHEALLAAMENLEDIKAWCKDRDADSQIINLKCLSLSSEALSKIDKVLADLGEK